jgi:hypothetical protein
MIRRTVFALIVASTLTSNAGATMMPQVAMPQKWDPLQHREIEACIDKLMTLARFGAGQEQGAFVVMRNDGGFDCVQWPDGDSTRHLVRFKGKIPVGTVATVHTHPLGEPEPSLQDRREANRLDVPFIVASIGRVMIVRPRQPVASLTRVKRHPADGTMASSAPSRSPSGALSPR